MVSRTGVVLAAALATSLASLARAESLTVCGQKVTYQFTATADPVAKTLVGVWVGEIIAFNAAYSVDYSRCWALVIEGVDSRGAIKAQIALADNTKNLHNGTRYGTRGYVNSWQGQLDPGGSTLRFVSGDGKNSYELQRKGATTMEGKVVSPSGRGTLSLSKQ